MRLDLELVLTEPVIGVHNDESSLEVGESEDRAELRTERSRGEAISVVTGISEEEFNALQEEADLELVVSEPIIGVHNDESSLEVGESEDRAELRTERSRGEAISVVTGISEEEFNALQEEADLELVVSEPIIGVHNDESSLEVGESEDRAELRTERSRGEAISVVTGISEEEFNALQEEADLELVVSEPIIGVHNDESSLEVGESEDRAELLRTERFRGEAIFVVTGVSREEFNVLQEEAGKL